jgi:PAS domain S-box-containing protein
MMRDITVPKNTELRLRESEELYRTTINSISDVLHVIDKDFRVILVNDALKKWYKSVGVNSNPVGLNLLETYKFLPSKVYDEYQKVFETKEPLISFEKIVLNNKIYYTETRKIPIVKENKVEQILTVIRDITESKISEQRLKDSEEKFRTISEESFVGIIINQDDITTYANQRASDIFGYTLDEMILMKTPEIINMVHPDDRDFFLNQKTKLFQNNDINALNYTFRARKKNGDLIWVTNYDKLIHFNNQLAILSIFIDITEQKKAEDALRESEERFKTLFEVVPFSIVYSDLNANILMCNKQFLKLHGIKRPEMIRGTNVIKFFSKQDIPKLRNYIQKSIEGGAPDPTEYIMLKEDGTDFRAEASSTAVRDKNGIVVGLIGVAQDITNRKKAEIELKESEEKFRTIAEQSFMGIIILQDGLFKYFNQRAADINGYSVEEIQNWKPHEFAKLIHPEDRDFVMEQARKKQSGETDVINRYTYRVIKKSGEIAWFDNYSKTVNYEGRSADLIMTEDITDKIIADQQLKESEEFFRTITEQSLLGIIIMQDGVIKYVNDIALNHSGYSRDEVLNLSETQLLKYIHPKDRDIVELIIAEPNPNLTFRLVTKDGNIKWIDLHNKKIIYKGKEAFLIALLDVTEKKEAEQIIQDEITKLKELDELKNEFVYRASHELKTPLNSIVSASTLLIESYRDSLDERAYSLINVVNKGGKRLDSLIGDLLDVSRIESRKLTIKKKKEDIVEIIKSCTHDMIYQINKRNLNVEFKQLHERIFIKIDKIRIEQVILNILSNSIKNTPSDGTISINIKSEKKFIDLSITDTGVGFTKKEKEKIFQKFGKIERYGKGLDIISEGTGLGLYISKEIIELHGGEIWVESKGRNKGSTIIIRLPNKN